MSNGRLQSNHTVSYFQKNAFGWYIMVIKDKKKADLINKILNDYENDMRQLTERRER